MTKATISTVQIGLTQVEGLMLPDGTFGIAIPQVAALFELSKVHASRDIKALLGNDFQLSKFTSELNPKAVNVLNLDEFTLVIKNAVAKGNKPALEILILLAGLSLNQLWSDAFGIKFEQEERQAWLKARQQGKDARRNLTDAIQDYITRHEEVSENYKRFIYSNCSNYLNKAIMKGTAKQLREKLVVPKNSLLRDFIPEAAVRELGLIEEYAKRLIDEDEMEPYEAVKMSCIVMKAKTISID